MTTEAGHVVKDPAIRKVVLHFLAHGVQGVLGSADLVWMGAVMKDNETPSENARTLCYGGI
jgi:hypothetical protein